MIFQMFSRKWLFTTLLVLAAAAVMARLGIWQLDRLEQRRAFNARVQAQINAPELALDSNMPSGQELAGMEYRPVTVTGEYDHEHEVALRNQAYDGQWGVHLITPLHITGADQTVLVDRGWIPGDVYETTDWSAYREPGKVVVHGIIRASRDRPDFGVRRDPTPVPGQRLNSWNFINVPGIQVQTPYKLLPIYVQQAPDPAWSGYPVRIQPELNLTEGSHMGYAIQWFGFAALLLGGYPFFIRKQTALAEQRAKAISV